MGIEYYAVDPETNNAYELGRGRWVLINDRMTTGPELKDVIREVLEYSAFAPPIDLFDYAASIASEMNSIFGEGKKLILDSDVRGEVSLKNVVGSRYKKAMG